jgi:rubrerythrin
MSEFNLDKEKALISSWRKQIETANQNNIFCHCQNCGYEWVDSVEDVSCSNCGSAKIEKILCWQFPDD